MSTSPFAPQYIHGVYIPSALLVVGTAIVKADWLPYAIGLAVVLGSWKIYTSLPRKVLDPNRKDFQEFELKEKTILSHNTAIYRFALPRPIDILGLPIGQHISLSAKIDNKDVMRSYTPISSDNDKGFFDLLIKSYPTGNISKHVAGLKISETIKVKGPKGAMIYNPNLVRRFGMIAGGTGITPMLQIIRAIVRGRAAGDETEIDLIFANVNKEDILLKEDLDALAKEDPAFRIYYVLNNPSEGWNGGIGFVTAEMIKEHLPPPAKDIKILVCGPPPMVQAMKKAVVSLGYDEPGKYSSKLTDQVFCF